MTPRQDDSIEIPTPASTLQELETWCNSMLSETTTHGAQEVDVSLQIAALQEAVFAGAQNLKASHFENQILKPALDKQARNLYIVLTSKDAAGKTLLMHAQESKNEDLIDTLAYYEITLLFRGLMSVETNLSAQQTIERLATFLDVEEGAIIKRCFWECRNSLVDAITMFESLLIQFGSLETIKRFFKELSFGANVLEFAAKYGRVDVLNHFYGNLKYKRRGKYDSLLSLAILHNQIAVIDWLLAKGVKIDDTAIESLTRLLMQSVVPLVENTLVIDVDLLKVGTNLQDKDLENIRELVIYPEMKNIVNILLKNGSEAECGLVITNLLMVLSVAIKSSYQYQLRVSKNKDVKLKVENLEKIILDFQNDFKKAFITCFKEVRSICAKCSPRPRPTFNDLQVLAAVAATEQKYLLRKQKMILKRHHWL